jgi:hypothetical protein
LNPETMPIGGNVTEERYRHDNVKGGLDWTISAERKNQMRQHSELILDLTRFFPTTRTIVQVVIGTQ